MSVKGLTRGAACFLFLVVLSLPFLASCQKEQPSSGGAPAKSVNPYSAESVFDEIKRELDKNPNNVDALYHLADLYDRNAQYPEAIETYKKVVKLKPDMGYAYFKMGTAYDRLNQPAEAVAAFKEAIKLLPKYAVVYNNIGVAYGKLGKLNEEVASLKKAISLRPNYSSAHFNLGMTYIRMKNKKAAMKEYEELQKFDEGVAAALLKEINKAA
jgi:tetratricopeptide (TPR) repeat protein